MSITLKTPAPPVTDVNDNEGDYPVKHWDIRYFEEEILTPKLMELTKSVNRDRCENVQVVKYADGRFFLLWDVRHPEMTTQLEYVTGEAGEREARAAWWNATTKQMEGERAKRLEYIELYKALPSEEFELPLTRTQALALLTACFLTPDGTAVSDQTEFESEIETLLCGEGE